MPLLVVVMDVSVAQVTTRELVPGGEQGTAATGRFGVGLAGAGGVGSAKTVRVGEVVVWGKGVTSDLGTSVAVVVIFGFTVVIATVTAFGVD